MSNIISISKKDVNLRFVSCDSLFLEYVGIESEEQVLGLTDRQLCWSEHADVYDKYELDALEGRLYSTIAPIKTYKKQEKWIFGNKKQEFDENNKLIGTITFLMEIINPSTLHLIHALENKRLYSDNFSNYVIGSNDFKNYLSTREQECLFYVIRGKSSKEIAKIFSVSPRTIERHIENIKMKFNCHSRSELTYKAMEQGFGNVVPKTLFLSKFAPALDEIV